MGVRKVPHLPCVEYLPLPDDHPSILSLNLAVRFFAETLSHARDKSSLTQWVDLIRSKLTSSPPAYVCAGICWCMYAAADSVWEEVM